MARDFRFGIDMPGTPSALEWLEFAREAERLGYSTLQFADHFGMHDPLAVLTAAAGVTSTIRLGAYVLCNDFRHPTVLAREAATIDVLSGGRLELGVGAGWNVDEYERAGIAFDRPGVRLARLEESIAVLRALFADAPASFHGEHYEVSALDGQPKPLQRPAPPFVVGGSRPKMLELAARTADIIAIAVSSTPDGLLDCADMRAGTLDAKLDVIRKAAGDRITDLELNTMITGPVVLADDREKGAAGILEFLRTAPYPIHVPDDFTVDDLLESPFQLIGTHEEIANQVVDLRERFGISYVTIMHMSMHDFAPVVEKLSGS
jgi:probable F420-dependent oxidoreductase